MCRPQKKSANIRCWLVVVPVRLKKVKSCNFFSMKSITICLTLFKRFSRTLSNFPNLFPFSSIPRLENILDRNDICLQRRPSRDGKVIFVETSKSQSFVTARVATPMKRGLKSSPRYTLDAKATAIRKSTPSVPRMVAAFEGWNLSVLVRAD